MKNLVRFALAASLLVMLAGFYRQNGVKAAGGPSEPSNEGYRVLAPIESGNLLLFPVVRSGGKTPGSTPFLTLDEGIKSGEVEVTEAGRVHGLVRPRGPAPTNDPIFHDDRYRGVPVPEEDRFRGDQVNTLVLVNNSANPSCCWLERSSPGASRTG